MRSWLIGQTGVQVPCFAPVNFGVTDMVNPLKDAPKNLTTIHEATKEMDRRRSKRPPELQIHASATLVAAGDPFAISATERQDLAGEIAQFCVPVDSKWVGNLRRHHVDMAFDSLKQSLLKKLREHGVMASGE